MDTAILREIGLTQSEIKVYLALLKLTTSTAGSIVDGAGLQNAAVHRILHALTEKGLITYSYEGKVKEYQAMSPERLLAMVDDRRAKLAKLIPQLEASRDAEREQPVSITFRGLRGIRELWNLLIEQPKQELLSYGAPGRAHTLLGDSFWKSHHLKRTERKIASRHIFNRSLKWRGEEMKSLPSVQVRYTEKEFEGLTETAICGDKVGIIIYLEKPVGFLINEALVASTYKKFFEQLWTASQ
ncbi:hypothetical protein GOV07_03285 [Candidatus Woesearchaeota archaeon]|nr:hypothetical protein [Candidatus Woesearchaeota archaeon]